MATPEIPEKLYYSISEVAEFTGIEPYVLRFWESEFSTLRPRKNKKGHRTYRKKDIELILKIKGLLYEEKYTIPGARDALSGKKAAPVPRQEAPAVKEQRGGSVTPPAASEDKELLAAMHRELADLLTLLDKERTEDIFRD